VFAECHRVLKDDGLLVFTYHHSRTEGWSALAQAVIGSGFSIVNAHPIKAEMSVATPKSQAKDPIQLDIIMVCRKQEYDNRPKADALNALESARKKSALKISKLTSSGLKLSKNDCRIVLTSQFIAELGPFAMTKNISVSLLACQAVLDADVNTSLPLETDSNHSQLELDFETTSI
jgi:putative DNA methylase